MKRYLYEDNQSLSKLRVFIPFELLRDILIKGFPETMTQAILKNLVPDNFHIMGNSDEVRITINPSSLSNKSGFSTIESIDKIEISTKIVSTDADISKLEELAKNIHSVFPQMQVFITETWSNDSIVSDSNYNGIFLPKEKWYMTDESLQLLKKYGEGKASLTPFWDAKHWAIGYGHMLNSQYQMGEKITQQQAEDLFRQDLTRFEDAVKSAIHVPLTLSMYGALVSYAYNVGRSGFKNSDVAAAVNKKDYKRAADILKTSKVHDSSSKYHKGLLARRARESDFFSGNKLT